MKTYRLFYVPVTAVGDTEPTVERLIALTRGLTDQMLIDGIGTIPGGRAAGVACISFVASEAQLAPILTQSSQLARVSGMRMWLEEGGPVIRLPELDA